MKYELNKSESHIKRHIIDDVISCECIDEQLEFQMIFACGYDHSVILFLIKTNGEKKMGVLDED